MERAPIATTGDPMAYFVECLSSAEAGRLYLSESGRIALEEGLDASLMDPARGRAAVEALVKLAYVLDVVHRSTDTAWQIIDHLRAQPTVLKIMPELETPETREGRGDRLRAFLDSKSSLRAPFVRSPRSKDDGRGLKLSAVWQPRGLR